MPNDRIRFLYAREPVFTAPMDSFQPQLDFMFGDAAAALPFSPTLYAALSYITCAVGSSIYPGIVEPLANIVATAACWVLHI